MHAFALKFEHGEGWDEPPVPFMVLITDRPLSDIEVRATLRLAAQTKLDEADWATDSKVVQEMAPQMSAHRGMFPICDRALTYKQNGNPTERSVSYWSGDSFVVERIETVQRLD